LVLVNNKAAVFASSNLGLSYEALNGTVKNYTKESGLQKNEFNTGSALKIAARIFSITHGFFYISKKIL
jgi:hypothetical protein